MRLNPFRYFPWKFLIRAAARSHGFLDPFAVLGALSEFNQPSEAAEPIELLRAGVVLHARGLINTKAIQHNLDWIWPWWVERQFDPADPAFVPRAFSITHVNLSHRNWTALGVPGLDAYPLVDPRGLVTPFFDGWSLDFWLVAGDGRTLIPNRAPRATQQLDMEAPLGIVSVCENDGMRLVSDARVSNDRSRPVLIISLTAEASQGATLVVALRPYNPEGVSFIRSIAAVHDEGGFYLSVNGESSLHVAELPTRVCLSTYREGDVMRRLDRERSSIRCPVGMASGALLYEVQANEPRPLSIEVPLCGGAQICRGIVSWAEAIEPAAKLELPVGRFEMLYRAALHTLVLLSPGEVFPGPYTYRRFWFRDAALMLHSMLCHGLVRRVREAIQHFPSRQRHDGFFRSQDGEWDANGEVLWLLERYVALSGEALGQDWVPVIRRAADWIVRKRVGAGTDLPHAGLLPAGFSAEHLGPSDYYYWDDFWGVAGLEAAAALCARLGDEAAASHYCAEADNFHACLARSIGRASSGNGESAIPASPYRRMDSGAIGSLVGAYPLELMRADDPRMQRTADYLLEHCFFDGGFFQDMIHSGINVYLTLQLAQLLLRRGDARYLSLLHRMEALASETGQWPEAIHPRTGGGCMGDGQHGWASAEWIMMLRSLFVYEEGDTLVLGAGLQPSWCDDGQCLRFGPALTRFGPISVSVERTGGSLRLSWQASWRIPPREIIAGVFGTTRIHLDAGSSAVEQEAAQ